jgi:hypothetical protein
VNFKTYLESILSKNDINTRLRIFKHKNGIDAAISVTKVDYNQDQDEWTLDIDWYNIVNPQTIFFIIKDTIVIPTSRLKDWNEF